VDLNGYMLAPKVLGSILWTHTKTVVHAHSIVLCAPKEMHDE
jgi:hypothetical protein